MNEVTAICIRPSGTTTHLTVRKATALTEIREHVGGYVEPVYVGGTTIWCNEDGRLLGLPYNPLATALTLRLERADIGYLVGTVVVTGGWDINGDLTPVSTDVASLLPEQVIR